MPFNIAHVLRDGLAAIENDERNDERRSYAHGDFAEPFIPPGLDSAYASLMDISGAPMVKIAVTTIVGRLSLAGIHTDPKGPADEQLTRILDANRFTSRQRMLYYDMLTYGYSIGSVWPNLTNPETPLIHVESPQRIFLGWSEADPFALDYVVKRAPNLHDPDTGAEVEVAYLYTNQAIRRFVQVPHSGTWQLSGTITNPLGRVPFFVMTFGRDSNGDFHPYVDPLIPIAQGIDTLRYDLLLAAQFAAWRQRVATGLDPVIRDADGNPIFQTTEANYLSIWDSVANDWVRHESTANPIVATDPLPPAYAGPQFEVEAFAGEVLALDDSGMPIPLVRRPGSVGTDRLLVFPGAETKVYDLEATDLNNYIAAANHFAAAFSASSHVPSQYLAIGDWSNVSGDTMEANDGALRSFVWSIHADAADGLRDMIDLVYLAMRQSPRQVTVAWRNMDPKSLSQVSSAASQMVPSGAPIRMFLEMLATSPYEVDRWLTAAAGDLTRVMADPAANFGPKPLTGAPDDAGTTGGAAGTS